MSKAKKEAYKLPISIGADPECQYLIGNKPIGANSLLGSLFAGSTPTYRGYKAEGGDIGTDAGDIGEFRPTFSWTIEGLVDNMKKMLKEIQNRGRIITASAKNTRQAVGGHIHFGISDEGTALQEIHRKLAIYCLPVMISEDADNVKKRMTSSNYGRLHDYRSEMKGNHRTYEIRFLSAEWLVNPKIMAATFAYLVTVLHEIKAHPENFEKDKEILLATNGMVDSIQSLTVENYPLLIQAIFKRIKKNIKTFELYPKLKKHINYLFDFEKVIEEKKKVDFDIMRGWGLLKTKPPAKKTLHSKQAIKTKMKGLQIDTLKQLLNFTYNDDTHVAMFVDELTNRVLAFNWKLNYQYLFFGLRKGFNGPVIANGYQEILASEDVKTIADLASLSDYMRTVYTKFKMKSGFQGPTDARNARIIGIPYEMRLDKDIPAFIDLILETEKTAHEPLKTTDLVDDQEIAQKTVHTEEEKEKLGKLFLFLSNKKNHADVTNL